MNGASLWKHTRRPLLVVAVLVVIGVLAAPLAARFVLDWQRWHQAAETSTAGPVWIDPDPWQMPYSHWRLRNATWRDEPAVARSTEERLTVRTATTDGRQFWTVSVEKTGQ